MVTRRSLLTGGVLAAGSALAGCSSDPEATPGTGAASASTPVSAAPSVASRSTSATQTPTPSPSPSPSQSGLSPTGGPLPTRAEIVARYRGRRPHAWGLEVPGMVLTLRTKAPALALTFDLCGGPRPTSSGCGFDRELVALLRKHAVRATFFLNKRWIEARPHEARDLAADPLFEIGNHGTRHMPLSVDGRRAYGERGTRDVGDAYDEVVGNLETLHDLTGHVPRWFRSGTAHADDVALAMLGDLGMRFVNFRTNGDAGTTFSARQIEQSLATVRAGDIVISHANRPEHSTFEGYRLALPRLLDSGLRFVTLSQGLA